MLQDVSLTIVFALLGSLVAAVVLVPFLFTRLTRRRSSARRARQFEEGRVMAAVEKLYARALRGTIDSGAFVILVAVLLLSLTFNLFSFLGFQFLPDVDNGEIVFTVDTPVGSTMAYTRSRAEMIQNVISNRVPEADVTVIYVGQSSNYSRTRTPSRAYGVIRLAPREERDRGALELMEVLRRETTANVPDTRCSFSVGGLNETIAAATGGSGFLVTVSGNDVDDVHRAALAIQSVMDQDPEIAETTVEIDRSYQEITASFDLATLGRLALTPQEAGIAARALFTGIQVGDMDTSRGALPVIVTSRLESGAYADDVWNSIYLVNHRMELVSFGAFTRTSTDRTFSMIPHVDREPAIRVTGTLRGSNIRAVRTRMIAALGQISFPFGVQWEITGQSAELINSFTTLLYAVAASVFLVYVVMVIQFERFIQPLIVLSSIPFTMIGVILTLLAFGSTLSVVSFLGIIALAGIVVNNAIVMIDYTNMLRTRYNVPLHEAVIRGASTRLRPILMTTLTTVLGLVPMALGLGEGGEFLAPLGQAIAGGLVTSTAVTLFLVPTLYWIVERRAERRLEARNRSEV